MTILKVTPKGFINNSTLLNNVMEKGYDLVVDTDTGELYVEKKAIDSNKSTTLLYYIAKNRPMPLPLLLDEAHILLRRAVEEDRPWGMLWSPITNKTVPISRASNQRQQIAKMIRYVLAEAPTFLLKCQKEGKL
jgi:hypothetical protein